MNGKIIHAATSRDYSLLLRINQEPVGIIVKVERLQSVQSGTIFACCLQQDVKSRWWIWYVYFRISARLTIDIKLGLKYNLVLSNGLVGPKIIDDMKTTTRSYHVDHTIYCNCFSKLARDV